MHPDDDCQPAIPALPAIPSATSTPFNYDLLHPSIRDAIREEARVIRGFHGDAFGNMMAAGRRLQWVHDQIGRNHFQGWLCTEFRWDPSVASDYMRVVRFFGRFKLEDLRNLEWSALCILVQKKVSQVTRDIALRLAQGGEFITPARALAIIAAANGTPDSGTAPSFANKLRRYVNNGSRSLPDYEKRDVVAELGRLQSELNESLKLPATPTVSAPA